MVTALRIVILPSVGFAVLLGVLHLGAAALGGMLPAPAWQTAGYIAAVAWSFKRCLDEVVLLRAPGAIVAVNVSSEGKVYAQTRGGTWLESELLPSTFVSHRLTILNLKVGATRRRRHVLLCPDNVDTADFRRLRVWLRWAATKSVNCDG
jgi:hypothetical protein